MAGRVTLQDIADALGVSRNTVSKAINNTGILAEGTREKVLKKAIEMGYKQFSYMNAATEGEASLQAGGSKEIALLTRGFMGKSSYFSSMLDRCQGEFARLGYSFTIYRIRGEDEEMLLLPLSFDKEKVSGIICIEMLDYRYCAMLCSLNLPVLLVDSPVVGVNEPLQADFLYSDNRSSICRLIREMARRGKRKIGFLGEYLHCQSFFERYLGYRDALYLAGLPCREEYCITKEGGGEPGAEEYQEYLWKCLSGLDALPEVFVCANDYVAFDAMRALKRLGVSVPQDVWLCGFDDTMESQIIMPSLTTVHIHSHVMGDSAAYLLASRIREPTLDCRVIHVQTSLLYRESTAD